MHRVRNYIFLSLLLGWLALAPSGSAQTQDYRQQARRLLAEMSVEERVGQIFMVAFEGSTVTNESGVASLIRDFKIGSVVLLAENDNITSASQPAQQVAQLTNTLQRLALLGPLPEETNPDVTATPPAVGSETPPASATATPTPVEPAVPLLLAISHPGDGPPSAQIHAELTMLPSQMAIGATWDPDRAQSVGEIAGRELTLLGINMLLGPALDVVENPTPSGQNDLGVHSFGGDPFWVGELGRAYTRGVHLGSQDRVAVIASHFPGFGSSDRPLNEEVGTVRKSLEQLKQIELAPFFAVTDTALPPGDRTDGLLTAHIRYQGFQGNIRAATAPVSFDPQALNTLMDLSEFAGWREAGGVIVSDALGAPAVQRFYDDTLTEFPHRQVAKDALLAGNDLLQLTRFALGDGPYDAQLENIRDTLLWFREKYATDQTFQQRIDEAALRILELKLRLYQGDFSSENVFVDEVELAPQLGLGQATVFDLAQQAITLIAPNGVDSVDQLPPSPDDNIVIFTDVRTVSQCSDCPVRTVIDQRALEQRMLALYGPEASAQVQASQFSSFSFAELERFLDTRAPNAPPPTPTEQLPVPESESAQEEELTPGPTPTPNTSALIEAALNQAELLLFATQAPDEQIPSSLALTRFLAERPDIVRSTPIVVLGFGAPYYLDTTEVSKLNAYFGIYSKIDPFVDAAVRALFEESPLSGQSPVNIAALGYDLFQVTQPDPQQVIELFILDNDTLRSPPGDAPLEVVPGATLRLQTGVIRDHNGNPVPDGTLVEFVQQERIQGFVSVIAQRPTTDGIANLDYLLEARTGNFRITVNSGEAQSSQEIDIVIGENAIVSVNTPTPEPTSTATPTATPEPTVTPSPQPTATSTTTPTPVATPASSPGNSGFPPASVSGGLQSLLLLGLGLLLVGLSALYFGRSDGLALNQTVRIFLWGVLGALLAYNYLLLSLPGSTYLSAVGVWAGFLSTVVGGGVGLALFKFRQRVS